MDMKKAHKSSEEKKELVNIMKSTTSVELHIEDFSPVREFYTDIGFEILFDAPGEYLTVAKDKALISFWGDGGRYPKQKYFEKWRDQNHKKGYNVEIIIPVEDVLKEFGL